MSRKLRECRTGLPAKWRVARVRYRGEEEGGRGGRTEEREEGEEFEGTGLITFTQMLPIKAAGVQDGLDRGGRGRGSWLVCILPPKGRVGLSEKRFFIMSLF